MSDTHPGAAEVLRQSVIRLTPAELLAMGCAMFDAARALAMAGLVAQGAVDSAQPHVRLFLRTYADDFAPDERDRIVERLSMSSVAVSDDT